MYILLGIKPILSESAAPPVSHNTANSGTDLEQLHANKQLPHRSATPVDRSYSRYSNLRSEKKEVEAKKDAGANGMKTPSKADATVKNHVDSNGVKTPSMATETLNGVKTSSMETETKDANANGALEFSDKTPDILCLGEWLRLGVGRRFATSGPSPELSLISRDLGEGS
ncbi:hypothetical protein LIER_07227 [Lithospermum erythrorhizon]|uniref:Uncharacterized protein n=1 Tax=Lithospermum erythrorhizon TaxID=34254 RepID=A0AAV3PBN7_LITER